MPARILLINPWIHDFAAANLWSRPLGLLQVAEYLSAYTSELRFIDCLPPSTPGRNGLGKYPKRVIPTPAPLPEIRRRYGQYGITEAEFRAKLREALPADAILVTGIMTYWYPGVQAVIRICKELAPHTPVVLGGIYARLCPEHARAHSGADVVYTGVADVALLNCLQTLGLSLEPRQAPRNYYQLGLYPALTYAPLLTSLGCPYACSYCASHQLQPVWKRAAPAAILRQIQDLSALGVSEFAFYDDALLAGFSEHLQILLAGITEAKLSIRLHTPNGLHARFLDATCAQWLRRAGFKTLRLSLETIDPARQAATGGKVATAEFEAALENLRTAGFGKSEIGVYLMYGLPGQDWEEVRAGAAYLMQRQVRICLAEFSPIPGTGLWNELVRQQVIPHDLDPLLTNNTVFSELYGGYEYEKIQALKIAVAEYNQLS